LVLQLPKVQLCLGRLQATSSAAVYKAQSLIRSVADITELLSFRNKSILARDLNAKHPFWNGAVSNPSGEKLSQLFDSNYFKISAPQHSLLQLWETVMCWILLYTRISYSHMSVSQTSWTQITYQ
jgi:hypothetical protein